MAGLTNSKIGILSASLALLFAATSVAQQTGSVSGLSSVPSNAIAFVHVDVVGMLGSPGMAIPTEIVAGVKQEADELFERHLGVRISELQTVTLVAPTFESLMAMQTNSEQACFGLFSFAQPVNKSFVENNLPETWRPSKIGKHTIFVEQDTRFAIFHCTANTIAFGGENGIRWLVKQGGNHQDNGLRSAMTLAESGHLTIGMNVELIPSEMKMFVPNEMKGFARAKTAAINIDFSNGIAAHTRMIFKSELDATNAAELARQNIEKARALLQQEEKNAQDQLKAGSEDLFASIEPLTQLAFIRYGEKILQRTIVEQTGNQLQAQVSIEGLDGQVLVISCLAAVQAIGSASKAEFQSVSEQLDSLE